MKAQFDENNHQIEANKKEEVRLINEYQNTSSSFDKEIANIMAQIEEMKKELEPQDEESIALKKSIEQLKLQDVDI